MKKSLIQQAIEELNGILTHLYAQEEKHRVLIDEVAGSYRESATNLVHYLSLRWFDIRTLQSKLGYLGLTRLARAEAHVENSLRSTLFYLENRLGLHGKFPTGSVVSIKKSEKLLTKHTQELLGPKPQSRRLRIMVTMPLVASTNITLVEQMIEAGMDCARINCAHDDPSIWEKMIKNINTAARKLDKKVKISMDLGGPKIRTGEILPGPKMKRFLPERTSYGLVNKPAIIRFVPHGTIPLKTTEVPVDNHWLNALRVGDTVHFADTRGKQRVLKIMGCEPDRVQGELEDSAYLITGLSLTSKYGETVIGELPAIQQTIYLNEKETLLVYREAIYGRPEQYDQDQNKKLPACISTTLPEVLDEVKVGESIYFDDGKLKGKIVRDAGAYLEVLMTQIKGGGAKLKNDKGINFPDSDLSIDGLTAKDKEDLKFIVQHADIVNFSFVNTPKDVESIYTELDDLSDEGKLGVILKIENKKGYDNLTGIIMAAMKHHRIGVMIARGDLAIEVGWKNIGMIQKEMLSICNASHVPVVWATQVLENLAKSGIPSRAEITDVVNGIKSECIMLNKGPHILQAITLLNELIESSEAYQNKNAPILPKLRTLVKK